jgi:hypothetical protein
VCGRHDAIAMGWRKLSALLPLILYAAALQQISRRVCAVTP